MDQDPSNPQSWNLYAYVRNNPLRFTDPNGYECTEDENGNFFGDCASAGDEQVTQSDISQQITVQQQLDNSFSGDVSAIGLNVAFALDNLANDFFSPISAAIGVVPTYMRNTPSGSGPLAKSAFVLGTVAGMVLGSEGEAEEGFVTVGKGLKNLRSIGSGRLIGYMRGVTELSGGEQGAREVFERLAGKLPTGELDRVVQGDKEFVFRAGTNSSSGSAAVEIIDHSQRTLEVVHFK